MLELWRSNPRAVLMAAALHAALIVLLVWSGPERLTMDSASEIESAPKSTFDIAIPDELVRQKLEQVKEKQQKQDEAIVGLRQKEDSRLKALREEQQKEQERLKAAALEREKLEAEKKRQQEEAEKARRLAEAEKKKAEEEKKRAEAEKRKAEEEKKKRIAEEKKKKQLEKQRLAEEKKLIEEAEKSKAERKRIAEEEAASKAAAARKEAATAAAKQKKGGTGSGGSGRTSGGGGGTDYNKYIGPIRTKIRRNWSRPAGIDPGLSALLHVRLFPGGGGADVRVLQSSGNEAFDQSAQSAVYKADPLPVPSGAAFDAFRSFKLKFTPEIIR